MASVREYGCRAVHLTDGTYEGLSRKVCDGQATVLTEEGEAVQQPLLLQTCPPDHRLVADPGRATVQEVGRGPPHVGRTGRGLSKSTAAPAAPTATQATTAAATTTARNRRVGGRGQVRLGRGGITERIGREGVWGACQGQAGGLP